MASLVRSTSSSAGSPIISGCSSTRAVAKLEGAQRQRGRALMRSTMPLMTSLAPFFPRVEPGFASCLAVASNAAPSFSSSGGGELEDQLRELALW